MKCTQQRNAHNKETNKFGKIGDFGKILLFIILIFGAVN